MTSTSTQLKTILDRNAKALELRPTIGQGTATTKVRLLQGLACEIEEGPWKLRADMSEKSGGTGTGPNPGVLGRASLASCLAIGYAMWAARRGIEIRSLEIEVQADYDTGHEYGLKGPSPGYNQVRVIVNMETDADPDEMRALLDSANRASSYLHVWLDPQDVQIEYRLKGAE